MAKKSAINRNHRRIVKSMRAYESRNDLREAIKKEEDPEKQYELVVKMQKRDRDESKIRIRDRCRSCGRPCGTYRKFGLCRVHLREAMMRGDVPGLKKASW